MMDENTPDLAFTDEQVKRIADAAVALAEIFQEFADALNRVVSAAVDFVQAFFRSKAWRKLVRRFQLLFNDHSRPQRRPDPVSRVRLLSARRHLPNTLEVLM